MNPRRAIKNGLAIVRYIPFTRAVYLTGSYAEDRATPKSDIDFFIQVEPGFLWSTRLFVTAFVQLAGLRRTETNIPGQICLNWFATFNAAAEQSGRVYKLLWQETKKSKIKTFLENLLSGYMGKQIETMLKKYQIARIERDRRTHAPGSQVRYKDTELGFHSAKKNPSSSH